jgi:hypothetical protein
VLVFTVGVIGVLFTVGGGVLVALFTVGVVAGVLFCTVLGTVLGLFAGGW